MVVATMGSELPAAAPQPKRFTAAAAAAARARRLAEGNAAGARKRIGKELVMLWLDPPPYCRPGAAPVKDHFHFEVVIDGPAGTPYAGGTFPVDVWLPGDYPFRPPKLFFKTKMYHPNIDGRGRMALDVFRDNWSPALTINKLLVGCVSVLFDPLLDHPVKQHIAQQYKYEYELYEKKAMAWTQKYSSKSIVSHYPVYAVIGSRPPAVPYVPATAERRKAAASSDSASVSSSRIELRIKDESLWRKTVRFIQDWSPYRLLHKE